MLSVPNGNELEAALEGLDLSVGLDFYVTETTAHCDYILPVTTMYERDDFALTFQQFQATPFRQTTEAVADAAGPGAHGVGHHRRPDDAGCIGAAPAFAGSRDVAEGVAALRSSAESAGVTDGMIRLSDGGDRFGLRRGGLTFDRLTGEHPHGVVVAPHIRTGVLGEVVVYRRGRIRLAHDDIAAEIAAMSRRTGPPAIRCG